MPTPIANHPTLEVLAAEASKAADGSYSPYSQFRVGCALLTADGTVIRGANIENASYGLTVCSERTTLLAATAAGHRNIPYLAVTCPDVPADDVTARPGIVMPCGACRQVMTELMAPEGLVAVANVGVFTLDELLPLAFSLR